MNDYSFSNSYQVADPFNGAIAEVLQFNRAIEPMLKWQIYGYLFSKWFGYTFLDGSQQTTQQRLMATSAAEAHLPQQYKKDYQFIDDLFYDYGNIFSEPEDGYRTFIADHGRDQHYFIIGGNAGDHLVGGFEDDIIIAGKNRNLLTGLGGADRFIVQNNSIILDFNPDEGDTIDFNELVQIQDPNKNGASYFNVERNNYGARITIDANGDGSGYTDAAVILMGHNYNSFDLLKLWANGNFISDGIRSQVILQLLNSQAAHTITESAGLEFALNLVTNSAGTLMQGFANGLPQGIIIPIDIAGSATFGSDYRLEVDYYDPAKEKYQRRKVELSGIPISMRQGDTQLNLYIIPIQDKKSEDLENIVIKLLPFEEAYRLEKETAISMNLRDGPDHLAIKTPVTATVEGTHQPGKIIIERTGSLDQELTVQLAFLGVAQNGKDYAFLPSKLVFPAEVQKKELIVLPYADSSLDLKTTSSPPLNW